MRIYLFAEHYPNPYKSYIDSQFVELLSRGHDATLFACGAFTSTVNDAVTRFGLARRTHYFPKGLGAIPAAAPRLAANLATNPLRRAHASARVIDPAAGLKNNFVASARALALPESAPDLCLVHDLVTAAKLRFLRRLYPRSRVAMFFHGGEVGGHARVKDAAAILNQMDCVFTNTEYSRSQVILRGGDPRRIAVLPVGFPLEGYPFDASRPYRPNGTLRLLTAGRLSVEKGHIFALQAIKQLVNDGFTRFHYRIVGSGREEPVLRQYVAEHGLAAYITFIGEQSSSDVAVEMANADVFLLPSIATPTAAETQACVVQESALVGALTIATRIGGVPESTAPDFLPFMAEERDPAALAGRIRAMAGLSDLEMRRLAALGRQFVAHTYDIRRITDRMLRLAMEEGKAEPAVT